MRVWDNARQCQPRPLHPCSFSLFSIPPAPSMRSDTAARRQRSGARFPESNGNTAANSRFVSSPVLLLHPPSPRRSRRAPYRSRHREPDLRRGRSPVSAQPSPSRTRRTLRSRRPPGQTTPDLASACAYVCTAERPTSKIKRRLEKGGRYLARHGSSHHIYRHQHIRGTIPLPRHRTVSSGVARSIANKAQWPDDQ